MRRTLYRKLILIYVILAIAGFTLISTVGSRMVEDSLVSSASTSLYREATQIASKQGDLYYHSERSLTDLYNSLSALASYHNSQIWLISADGEILLNTAAALDEENPEIIDGFDPVALGSEYYSTGTFFGYFKDKMLSVMVPVTSDFGSMAMSPSTFRCRTSISRGKVCWHGLIFCSCSCSDSRL